MSKMKPEIKKLWVEALKSDKYEQGFDALHPDGKFCCLGVLTDLYCKETGMHWGEVDEESDIDTAINPLCEYLPECVQEWAGLDRQDPLLGPDPIKDVASNCNDGKELPFPDIADLIEREL